MFRLFLKERRSWITFFVFWLGLLIFLSFLDIAIPIRPILYVVFLSLILFILFLILRYRKETAFYKSINEWQNDLDLSSVTEPSSPFEELIEKRIIEQTRQLKQNMAHQQTELEQEKDDLLSWIHEVKTPLTAMHLMIERMDDGALKSDLLYEWLRIHILLDQQLHQKRIAFMENDLYIEKVDLESLIFNEIKTLRSWCIQKGIGFEIDLQVTEVISDGKWLSFILRQLLSNAVKYSRGSDIIISSRFKEQNVILEIRDSGKGIDPKDMPRIFEKGFTSTTRYDKAATGMGLYLARKAAFPLRIEIEIDSKLEKGTTAALIFAERNEFSKVMDM